MNTELAVAWDDVAKIVKAERRSLRGLFPDAVRTLAERNDAAFSFLAVEDREVVRSAVLLVPAAALLLFDHTESAPLSWKLTGNAPLPAVRLLEAEKGRELLHVVPLESALEPRLIDEMDMAGAGVGSWILVFHRGRYANGSAVHFEATGTGPLEFLVTGLAPGTWDIWRNGWSVEQVRLTPPHGSIYFRGKAGMHFLRRLS